MDAITDWRKDVQRAFFFADGTIVAFDVVVSEEHTSELEVTDNPVETGVVVSDHAFAKPDSLELVLIVSDTPANGVPSPDPFASIISRSATAWQWLKGLQKSAVPFEIQTGLQLYQNMVITRANARQDKDTAGALIVTVSLREVLFVSTQTVTYPPRKTGKTTRQASKTVNRGDVATKPVTDPQKAKTVLFGQFFSSPPPRDFSSFTANP